MLVEQGYIPMEQLKEFIRKQVEEIIYDLFFWEIGEFEYKDAKLNLSGMVVTEMDIMSAIMEASRRVDEMSVLRKQIPADTLILKHSRQLDKDKIELSAQEWDILRLVDGKRTVKQLIEPSDLGEFTVLKILYSLMSSGLVERVEDRQDEAKEVKEDLYSDIISGYTHLLQLVCGKLEAAMGPKIESIFSQSKSGGDSSRKNLFANFNPHNPKKTNMYVIREQLKEFSNTEEGRVILVISFNQLLTNILEQVPEALIPAEAQKALEEIKAFLPEFEKYRTGPMGEPTIVPDAKWIIKTIEKKIADQ